MSTTEEVEVKKDNGGKLQWAKGYFYRQEGNKARLDSRRFTKFTVILFTFTSLILILREEPKKDEKLDTISSPNIIKKVFKLPIFRERSEEEIYRERSNKKVNKIIRYSRLSVISRSRNVNIPPGSTIKAKLVGGASNGRIKAISLEPVVVAGDILIPEGVTFWGTGFSTEERLMVKFTKVIFEDGKVENAKAHARDLKDNIEGLRGSKVSKFFKGLAINAGLNFASGFSEGLQEHEVKDGVAIKKPSTKNAILNGVSRAAVSQSKSYMESLKSQQTVIKVPKNTVFYLMYDGEM